MIGHKKIVFVTGATGFIGSHIAQKLIEKGFIVHALRRKSSPKIHLDLTWHEGDLTDGASLEKILQTCTPHIIVHAAAYGIDPNEQAESSLLAVNLQATCKLLVLAQKYQVQKWIQMGSCSEYAPQLEPLTETALPIPLTIYGMTKLVSTQIALQQAQLHSLPLIVILRLFGVYGPREHPGRLVPSLLSAGLQKKPVSLTAGYQIRDFIYVEDVAELVSSLAMRSDFPGGEIFNVGSGVGHTLREAGALVEQLTGVSGLFLWGTKAPRAQEYFSLIAQIDKSRKILGWNPPTSLQEGMMKTLAYMRKTNEHNIRPTSSV